MHEFIVFNREIIRFEKSFLSAVSSAALYGKGVFTTVAVRGAQPFLWDKHWRRLSANAAKINVDLSAFSETEINNSLHELIFANSIADARARITFFDESQSIIWSGATAKNKTSFLIQTADFRAVSENLRLAVSPFPLNTKSPLAGVKSCNYLENILALEAARRGGFDEAVRLNERGEIAGAATANIFWTHGERIYTPALETGCLAGTTREFICEKFPVSQVKAALDALDKADGIFLTSAGIGVAPIAQFRDKKLSREAICDFVRLINAEMQAQ
jgi:branched-chain amino acid aminotransferase